MKIIFLGTGTSQGIPVIGCDCSVCLSSDPKDNRLRSSVMFIKDGFNLLIDMGPDLRQQLLSNQLTNIDAICITHEHNDHVSGLDEIRPINFRWKKSIPIYAQPRVNAELKRRFHYAFETSYAARPRLTVNDIEPSEHISLGPFEVVTVAVQHGSLEILGYIVDDVAYLTDVKTLDKKALKQVSRCQTVILSALHKREHPSHQTLEEAKALITQLDADRYYITHIAHQMGHHKTESNALPENMQFAYDGLILE